jgi:hypothetical protein
MRRSYRQAAGLLALGLLLFPLGGCERKDVLIRIPDFESKLVKGIWLWRLSETTGEYERDGEVVFHRLLQANGREKLEYETIWTGADSGFKLQTDVLRDPLDPDVVTLRLDYFRASAPGDFRASSYNDEGESPLTQESIQL